MPYGEPFINERISSSSYEERYTFTGKERDSETGYSYFGARFYDSDLMTGWLSIDPQSDKFPNISPYNYCNWNPVKLKDLDGEAPVKAFVTAAKLVKKAYNIYKKTGNLTMKSLKKAGLDELIGIVDDINTIFSGDASLTDRIAAGVDLLVGTELNNKNVNAAKTVSLATKNNYRKKLQDATGKTGKGYEAHHTLPQKYEEKFNEAGINIHEPGNTVWRETDNHRGKSHQHIKE
jgi:RHS repeat-associated protein